MIFAIIAAGEGSRLAAEGITTPKPLVQLNGETLIDRLIRIFMRYNPEEIVVICNDRDTEVAEHLYQLQRDGLQGTPVPLRFLMKSTPSSMHSFYEISPWLGEGPFVLTTVDTIFSPLEFDAYVKALENSGADGVMGVTNYVDDEKPLWVDVNSIQYIEGFYDVRENDACTYISAGVYGLYSDAVDVLKKCVERGESRMRNFQRALIAEEFELQIFPFTQVFDIDHAADIEKAEQFLHTEG